MTTKITVLALALAIPGVICAQNNTPPAGGQGNAPATTPPANPDVQKDKQEIKNLQQDIKSDRDQMKDLAAKHAADVKDLNTQEKAAKDAVLNDKSLTPRQRKEKLAAISKDFNDKRKALNEKFRDAEKAIHKDIKKDKHEIHRDRHEINETRKDMHHDMHHK